MTAEQLLNELGLTMGLPELRFDDQGCACLQFDQRTMVHLEKGAEPACLQLYAVLGRLPAHGRETLYLKLLQGNLFGHSTQGATLAVDTMHNEIVLCRTLDLELLGGPTFCALIEQFVAAVEHWTSSLLSGDVTPATPSTGLPEVEQVHLGSFIRA